MHLVNSITAFVLRLMTKGGLSCARSHWPNISKEHLAKMSSNKTAILNLQNLSGHTKTGCELNIFSMITFPL